jgi:hypothetical protein
VTPEELQRRTAIWFTEDDQDQPEIPIEPGAGSSGNARYGCASTIAVTESRSAAGSARSSPWHQRRA